MRLATGYIVMKGATTKTKRRKDRNCLPKFDTNWKATMFRREIKY